MPALPRGARFAVGVLFAVNGALFANVVPRLPDLKADLGLSNAELGAALAAYPAGALLLGLVGGALVARFTSRVVAPLTTLAVAANLVLLGQAPTGLLLAVTLFLAGTFDATADVANNAHALRVERRYGRSILNGLHAMWSIGAVTGAGMGAAAIALGLPVGLHLALAAALLAAITVAVRPLLLPGRDDDAPAQARQAAAAAHAAAGRGRRHVLAVAVALGLVAAAAQLMEDAAASWSAIYLRDLGTSASLAGAGFVALQGFQVLGRLLGDPAVSRFGDRAVARSGAALAAVAMAGALAAPTPVTTVVALGAVGLGIGTLIPAAYRTADALPGLATGAGIALVATVNRVVTLVSPAAIGAVADAVSLRVALLAMPLAAVVVLAAAAVLPRR